MSNQPYLPLYTGDWMKDPKLSFCSPATRGIWIDLLCAMHELGRAGELRGTTEQLARLARCLPAELEAALTDLQSTDAASVEQRNGIWTVVCRRMKKAADISHIRSIAASKSRAKPEQNTEYDLKLKLRLGDLFKRRHSTPWSEKEEASLARLRIDEEDLALVEKYYRKEMPKDRDYRRRDLFTLLNNWQGEVDRAKHGTNGSKPIGSPQPKPQPEGWIAWRKQHYPEAQEKDFWRVPEDVQREFRESLRR